MRVLVVADDPEVRALRSRDLERAGHEVSASDGTHATARARATRPDVLLLAEAGATSAVRLLLARARAAAERALPALLLFDDTSPWLRAALPDDFAPAGVLPAVEADALGIDAALRMLVTGQPVGGRTSIGAVVFDRAGRRLEGPAADVSLTPSEAAVLALLVARPGEFVSVAAIARALWGDALTDRYARGAIRSHVHTLRGKLVSAGLPDAIESKSAVWYRLVTEAVSR